MTDETFSLSRIGQIAVVVHDLERSTAFYRDTLGLPVAYEVPGRMSFFDCDGTWLMLSLPEGEGQDHPASVLYFDVDDIGRAHRILAGRSVDFVQPPHKIADVGDRELWMAFFKDADWNLLALRSWVAK